MQTKLWLGIVLLCPLASQAADVFDIKPGLWEMTSTVQVSGMPPIPNLDQMTPEQRARVEGMMKNMGGAHSNTTKSCVTRESIDKALANATSSKNNTCTNKLVSATSSKVVVHMECTGTMKSSGDMTFDRKDSEHFSGAGTMKSAAANGRSMDTKWSMNGTFVSSDCGNVKPSNP